MPPIRSAILVTMFYAAARAFGTTSPIVRGAPRASFAVTRFMSTTEDPTSVVATCQEKIQAALEADNVKVTGAYDDPNGSHISIEVVSKQFEGKRAMQRQQMVYKAIWEELQGPVHAVDSMVCKTPDEA